MPEPEFTPNGNMTAIELRGRDVDVYVSVHQSGAGPGLLMLSDEPVLDETLPSNIFMQDSWATSHGKPL